LEIAPAGHTHGMDATHTDTADPQIIPRPEALRGLLSTQPNEVELTDRELTVLDGVSRGMTNREIADELFLSVDTVKTHARRLYAKLGVSNRTQAAMRGRWRSDLPSSPPAPAEDSARFA
jgi:DNA-binding NarL/FixJ family response regulator